MGIWKKGQMGTLPGYLVMAIMQLGKCGRLVEAQKKLPKKLYPKKNERKINTLEASPRSMLG